MLAQLRPAQGSAAHLCRKGLKHHCCVVALVTAHIEHNRLQTSKQLQVQQIAEAWAAAAAKRSQNSFDAYVYLFRTTDVMLARNCCCLPLKMGSLVPPWPLLSRLRIGDWEILLRGFERAR
jgi:hypothetical protein